MIQTLRKGRAKARVLRGRLPAPIQPFLTTRFIKFCAVGASGVVVNLGCLALFVSALGMRSSWASALAIELSILSNFVVNELWTFRDQRSGGVAGRAARFQLVSLVGAAAQWLIFLIANMLFLKLFFEEAAFASYAAGAEGFIDTWLIKPIETPPPVGGWIYLSQLVGIAVATGWNYLANFYWTWGQRETDEAA